MIELDGVGQWSRALIVQLIAIKDLILRDDALLYIALSVHPLSQLPGGAAFNPQLVAMTADRSST